MNTIKIAIAVIKDKFAELFCKTSSPEVIDGEIYTTATQTPVVPEPVVEETTPPAPKAKRKTAGKPAGEKKASTKGKSSKTKGQ